MRKLILINILFVFYICTTNLYANNSYFGNLTYDESSSITECTNQTNTSISGVKFIPITNDLSAATSDNADLCESHGYFSGTIDSSYINQNTSRSCDDYGITDGYVYDIKCYDYSDNEQPCNSDGSGWIKYKIFCNYKFDDSLVDLNSAPLKDESIIADGEVKNVELGFPLNINGLEEEIDSIDLRFKFVDNTSIDWFSKDKNSINDTSVIIDSLDDEDFNGEIRTGTYSLDNGGKLDSLKNVSDDGFNLPYKFYNLTRVASDIFPSVTDGFIVKTVDYDIYFTDGGSINGFYAEDKENNTNIIDSTIPIKVSPLLELSNTGVVFGSGLVEGTTQTGQLTVINNDTSISITGTGLYFSMTGTTTNPDVVDDFTGTGNIDSGDNKDIDKDHLVNNFLNILSDGADYIIETLFTLVDGDGTIDDIVDLRVREFIRYSIGGRNVTYLAGVMNQSNSQNFETLKIYGRTNISTDKQKDLLDNQDIEDIQNLAGNITKASLKRDIRKRAINSIKFVDTENISAPIDNIDNDSWDASNGGKVLGSILYYDFTDGSNAIIGDGAELSITGKKTLIVRGGNIRITQNIINATSSDILGIIVLKGENGLGGKVYIDSNVDEVDAIIYSDKSIIGYNIDYDNGSTDDIIKHEVDGNINNEVLDNQLYIYGSVFSENTIGGSRIDPPVCPFWTTVEGIDCNTIEAQKYDFNYLRTGLGDDPNYTGDPITGLNYPIVIKYNSAVQSTPPPLFGE